MQSSIYPPPRQLLVHFVPAPDETLPEPSGGATPTRTARQILFGEFVHVQRVPRSIGRGQQRRRGQLVTSCATAMEKLSDGLVFHSHKILLSLYVPCSESVQVSPYETLK